jgi:cation:H+ antiporter
MALEGILCVVGFVLLYYGAEWLVKGSSSLARSAGISPIVIGLTVVAFGTSAPELVVSVISSIRGQSMIAVGNVIGSNICNIALVLGMAAALRPIRCDPSVVRRDIPIMLAVSVAVIALCWNDVLGRVEGIVLFAGILVYTAFNYRIAMREKRERGVAFIGEKVRQIELVSARWKQILLVVVGIGGVVGGAQLVVESATTIMKAIGVDEKFIGVTIVAFGTSLPELATSVVAAIRKEMDISVGNLVGSNVFNLLSVLGVASIVSSITIQQQVGDQMVVGYVRSGMHIDGFVMLFVSALPWFMMRKNAGVGRLDGFVLLACYGGFLAFLIARATG